MKIQRIMLMLILCLMTNIYCSARDNTFGVGVESTFKGHNMTDFDYNISVDGVYRLGLSSRFSVTPKVGVGIAGLYDFVVGGPSKKVWHHAFSTKIGAEASLQVVAGLHIITGPEFNYLWRKSPLQDSYGYWTFGAGYRLWRFQLQASYNVKLYDTYTDSNSWSIGIRYFFK